MFVVASSPVAHDVTNSPSKIRGGQGALTYEGQGR